ncbi:hypothetical protein [Actinomadura sp. 9N215]|uniref:hypothetical protein n=1 Tax=Actinomadura sp. 9N215 TaxID=3375150 RepID=UPI0037A61310
MSAEPVASLAERLGVAEGRIERLERILTDVLEAAIRERRPEPGRPHLHLIRPNDK